MKLQEGKLGSAVLSDDEKYRYLLYREWGARPNAPAMVAILLNPSTADADVSDPTVTRVIDFATHWGYGGLILANIFALRATDPKELKQADDPVGEYNNFYLDRLFTGGYGRILLGWGNLGALRKRSTEVLDRASSTELFCLGTTQRGEPKHPLYLAASTLVERYT